MENIITLYCLANTLSTIRKAFLEFSRKTIQCMETEESSICWDHPREMCALSCPSEWKVITISFFLRSDKISNGGYQMAKPKIKIAKKKVHWNFCWFYFSFYRMVSSTISKMVLMRTMLIEVWFLGKSHSFKTLAI